MKKHLFVIACLLLAGIDLSAAGKWKLEKNSDGIKSYSRSVPGTDILEIKAITVIDARMEVVGEVLRDVSAMPRWMADCSEARIVKMFNRNDMIVHIVLDFPMPVNDRDLVVRSSSIYDLKHARGIVNLRAAEHPDAPLKKGRVRMSTFSGTYQLEYLSRNKTGVIYSYRADPGGNIPPFVVNMFSKKSLYKTLMGLKRMVRVKKYTERAEAGTDRLLFEKILKDKKRVREILRARLLEQVRDAEAVDEIIKNDEIFNIFVNGDGDIARTIFLSWGSSESIKKAVKKIIRIHLRKYTRDEALIGRIAEDDVLIRRIIRGKKKGDPSLENLIKRLVRGEKG